MIRKLIGHINVISGNILLIDPALLNDWRDGAYPADDGNSYHRIVSFLLENKYGEFEEGVGISTPYGDGGYPVFVLINDKNKVAKIEIELIETS